MMGQTIHPHRSHGQRVAKPRSLKSIAGGPLWPHALLAMYGISGAFTVKAIGNFYLSEILAVMFLPFVAVHKSFFEYKYLRLVIAGYILILLGLVVSDLANYSHFEDWARGWANPIFAITCTLFIASVLRYNVNSFLSLLLSMFLANLIWGSASYGLRYDAAELSFSAVQQDSNILKIRFIPFIMPLIMLLLIFFSQKSKYLGHFILWSTAVVFSYFDARSAALTLIITSILSFYIGSRVKISAFNLIPLFIAFMLVFQISYMAYVSYSLNEPNSHNAKQLSSMSNPYNPIELLIEGRTESFVVITAIMDKPIIGFGSWAKDKTGEYSDRVDIIKGYNYSQEFSDKLLIPAHSTILGFWLWGGVISFIGILIVFRVALIAGWAAANNSDLYRSCVVMLIVSVAWDMFFSPLGAIRLNFPQALALAIVLSANRPQIAKFRNKR